MDSSWPARFRRDRRADAVLLAQQMMVVRRIETCVADQVQDRLRSRQFHQHAIEFGHIGRRPDAGDGRQNRARRAINDDHQLAVRFLSMPLFRPFFVILAIVAPPDEISADVVGVETAGVHRSMLHLSLAAADLPHRVIHQTPHARLQEQSPAGFLQRGEMRNRRQAMSCWSSGQSPSSAQMPRSDRSPAHLSPAGRS